MDKTRKQHILDCISDGVSKLLYYDRKEDPDLPPRAIDAAVLGGEITVDEMVAEFRKGLEEGLRA